VVGDTFVKWLELIQTFFDEDVVVPPVIARDPFAHFTDEYVGVRFTGGGPAPGGGAESKRTIKEQIMGDHVGFRHAGDAATHQDVVIHQDWPVVHLQEDVIAFGGIDDVARDADPTPENWTVLKESSAG
jgi:hypothetical protein